MLWWYPVFENDCFLLPLSGGKTLIGNNGRRIFCVSKVSNWGGRGESPESPDQDRRKGQQRHFWRGRGGKKYAYLGTFFPELRMEEIKVIDRLRNSYADYECTKLPNNIILLVTCGIIWYTLWNFDFYANQFGHEDTWVMNHHSSLWKTGQLKEKERSVAKNRRCAKLI